MRRRCRLLGLVLSLCRHSVCGKNLPVAQAPILPREGVVVVGKTRHAIEATYGGLLSNALVFPYLPDPVARPDAYINISHKCDFVGRSLNFNGQFPITV